MRHIGRRKLKARTRDEYGGAPIVVTRILRTEYMGMLRCFMTGFIASFVTSSLPSVAIAGTPKAVWPRLAGTKYGPPHAYGDPTMQAQLAKLDYLFIDFFPNWGSTDKMRAALKGIKEKNPDIIILDYVMQETISQQLARLQPLRDISMRKHGGCTGKAGPGPRWSPALATLSRPTLRTPSPRDANGDRWNTWFAKHVYRSLWSKVPELDGTFTDNVFWKPRVNGDWDRNGTTDSHEDKSIYPTFRAGMMRHLHQIRALVPGKIVAGNIGDWGRPETTVPEYAGQLDGGLLEHYIGATWSHEGVDLNGKFNGWGSWDRMMAAYRKVMSLVRDPKLVVFNMKGKPTDYKSFRYGFASALMDDAYFDFSDGTGGSVYKTDVVWFDEYDLAGEKNTRWLGPAVDPPQTKPWQKGVYRRRFQNGMALVNPRGNGDQIVTVGPGFKRFKGRQDPAYNNGSTRGDGAFEGSGWDSVGWG
jgi:hypothetical protein